MFEEVLKKAFKPVAAVALTFIGLTTAAILTGPKTWSESFSDFWDRPVGPAYAPDSFWQNKDEDGKVTLHAGELRQLRWMSTSQLKAIFNGRRGQFKVESSPEAYKELRWMSTDQLTAIFGTADIP